MKIIKKIKKIYWWSKSNNILVILILIIIIFIVFGLGITYIITPKYLEVKN